MRLVLLLGHSLKRVDAGDPPAQEKLPGKPS
jgi:hypothetical protein